MDRVNPGKNVRTVSELEYHGYVKVEKEGAGGSTFYVLHRSDPAFGVEIVPEFDTNGGLLRTEIKRFWMPNSWTGDYHLAGAKLKKAVEFFKASFT